MEIIEYPKMIYREPGGEHQVVHGPDEEAELKEAWGLVPADEGAKLPYKISDLRKTNKARLMEMARGHGLEFAPDEVTWEELIDLLMDLNP